MGAYAKAAQRWAIAVVDEERAGTARERTNARRRMSNALGGLLRPIADDEDRAADTLLQAFDIIQAEFNSRLSTLETELATRRAELARYSRRR